MKKSVVLENVQLLLKNFPLEMRECEKMRYDQEF
jgi:hypothetical protein